MNLSQQAIGNQVTEISNALHEGEYADFRSAIKALLKAYRLQKRLCDSEDEMDRPEYWEKYIKEAEQALAIYNEAIKAAEKQASDLMAEKGLDIFAEALEQGSYEGLAF